jgi:uroporphyrinogen decarboxylase
MSGLFADQVSGNLKPDTRRLMKIIGMTARENALRIIRFDRPERIVGGPPSHKLAYLGCDHEGWDGTGDTGAVGSVWTTVWGVVMRKEQEGVMGFPQHHPLAEIESLRTYAWPDPDDERICGRIEAQRAARPGDDVFLSGSHRETLWEKGYMLVGMERLMTYLFTEPGYVREIFRRIMDFDLGIARHYLAAGAELAGLGDDLGTQIGPLLGPDTVREFLVPEYRRLFDFYKKNGVRIGFHSCGRIDSLLDIFMELGVDVLNPVQATANDLAAVRAKTAGRMALQGAVSSATVMDGPVRRIVAEARQRMWQLGRDGGYFCGADQGLPFPKEHVDALNETVREYGRYPLTPVGE